MGHQRENRRRSPKGPAFVRRYCRRTADALHTRGAWVSNVWRAPIHPDRPATWDEASAITSDHAFIEFVDLSADGERLAVSSDRRGNQDLWVLPSGGGDMTQITTDPAADWDPRWSPDGREIAFYSVRSGNRDVWVMPSAGGPARQLTSNPRRESEPNWSPDGRQVSFRSRGPMALWIVSAAGGDPRLLAENFVPTPTWSPDGRWLLTAQKRAFYRLSPDGGTPTAIPFDAMHEPIDQLAVSKDSQFVYYSVTSGPKANRSVWRLSLSTGAVSPLLRLEGRRGLLGQFFAADAQYLYFTWREDEGDLWVMDVAGPA